jgi:hypothetical protein
MPRTHSSLGSVPDANAIGDVHAEPPALTEGLTCSHCSNGLECVEQNRREGAWVGSYICPRCRSEYFYAYRWGRLLRKN